MINEKKQTEAIREYYTNIGLIYLALCFVSLLFFLVVTNNNGFFEFIELWSFLLIFIFGILGGVYLICRD